jgi:opacity protein-like surface antigen
MYLPSLSSHRCSTGSTAGAAGTAGVRSSSRTRFKFGAGHETVDGEGLDEEAREEAGGVDGGGTSTVLRGDDRVVVVLAPGNLISLIINQNVILTVFQIE